MGWNVGLYSVGACGNGGAEGPDHAVWLTSLVFFSLLPSAQAFFFSLGRNWLYGPTRCHGNGRKTFSVRSKAHDLFRDRGLGPCALNDCGLGCCADLRGICLGES